MHLKYKPERDRIKKEFDNTIKTRCSDARNPSVNWIKRRKWNGDQDHQDEENDPDEKNHTEDALSDGHGIKANKMPEVDSVSDFDQFIHTEVIMSRDGTTSGGTSNAAPS